MLFSLLDFILGNKSMTSNFMTTSALADMIEREFHSCQVILFLNLFFIIPEKQACFIKSIVENGSYCCRIHHLYQPQQCWKVMTRSALRQQHWQGSQRVIPRHEWLCYLWPGQVCQASKQSIQDKGTLVCIMCNDLLWKKNVMVKKY